MKVEFTEPTKHDRQEFSRILGNGDCLVGRVKIVATDGDGHQAELFVHKEVVERLGEDYIHSHLTMLYVESLDRWFAKISENDYYNDPVRNPEKVIRVTFDGIEGETGREVYKGIETERYYLREVFYPREDFARWFICGKRRAVDDGDEPRANIIFEHGSQRERVRYDDWNGVAAYSDTFNKDFRQEREAEA